MCEKQSKKKNLPDLEFLNEKFSVDHYIQLNQVERIEFRMELKKTIKTLQRNHSIVWMSNENLVKKGLESENKIAQAISILEEWASAYHYDSLFYFKECIADLKTSFDGDVWGKKLFYNLDKNVMGLDKNYSKFILGSDFECK